VSVIISLILAGLTIAYSKLSKEKDL
jgi:hypothetical protein